jgi:hypothetical protein
MDDAEGFAVLVRALAALGVTDGERQALFRAAAGILHLGQLTFAAAEDHDSDAVSSGRGSGDGCKLRVECLDSLAHASRLLGVHSDELIRCLTTRGIVAASESYVRRLTPQQAADARDALARHMYGGLFAWLVSAINRGIGGAEANSSTQPMLGAFIGVLDIFGFESFQLNSLEQLCINYTNESLQQQFNQYVFKLEEQEHLREGIAPLRAAYPDNQDCLDLIEHRASGLLAVLEDECRLPAGCDRSFAARLYKAHGGHARFRASAKHIRSDEFVIRHYAGEVCYSAHLFVDKSRDELPKECSHLLCSASNSLIKTIFSDENEYNAKPITKGGSATGSKSVVSVGMRFRDQLHELLDLIAQTVPHYIRCIKPNDCGSGDIFDRARCVEQLRHCGVLEAVRVARAGFPVRLGHRGFFARYRPLANPHAASALTAALPRRLERDGSDPKEMCRLLLRAIMDDTPPSADASGGRCGDGKHSRLFSYQYWRGSQPIDLGEDAVQLGATKVFLRRRAHELLEGMAARRLQRAALKVQAVLRASGPRAAYRAMRSSALRIQSVFRGHRARSHAYQLMLLRNAAVKIQSSIRRFCAVCRYRAVRRRLEERMATAAAIMQGGVRMCVARRRFMSLRAAAVALQSAFRQRRLAESAHKSLKQEQEDKYAGAPLATIPMLERRAADSDDDTSFPAAGGQAAAAVAERKRRIAAESGDMPMPMPSSISSSPSLPSSGQREEDQGENGEDGEHEELAGLRARYEEERCARLAAEHRVASVMVASEAERAELLARIDALMRRIESSLPGTELLLARIEEERRLRTRLEAQVAALEAAVTLRAPGPPASPPGAGEATSHLPPVAPVRDSPPTATKRARARGAPPPLPSAAKKATASAPATPRAGSGRRANLQQQQEGPRPSAKPPSCSGGGGKVEAFVAHLREVRRRMKLEQQL